LIISSILPNNVKNQHLIAITAANIYYVSRVTLWETKKHLVLIRCYW